jgi:hypothetical protein
LYYFSSIIRIYEPPVLSIFLEKDIELSENLKRINEYINWLGNKCEQYLEKYIHKIIMNDKGYDGLEWYITFNIFSGIIEINKNGKILANIAGLDFAGDGWHHVVNSRNVIRHGAKICV